MGEALVRMQKASKVLVKSALPPRSLPQPERAALHAMRMEATDVGVTLSDTISRSDVHPTVALEVMRRDRYQCCLHDDCCTGPLHVVSKHPARFVWHHRNIPDNLITVCKMGTATAQQLGA